MHRVHDGLGPEFEKAFQFRVTCLERYLVACDAAGDGGHFRACRDNTTKGTADRQFAVSLSLHTGEFAGGFVRFPEYGPHRYSAPGRRGGRLLVFVAARGRCCHRGDARRVPAVPV